MEARLMQHRPTMGHPSVILWELLSRAAEGPARGRCGNERWRTPAQRAKSGRVFWKMRGDLILLARLAQARFLLPDKSPPSKTIQHTGKKDLVRK